MQSPTFNAKKNWHFLSLLLLSLLLVVSCNSDTGSSTDEAEGETAEEQAAPAPQAGDWYAYGKDQTNRRYSPLDEINTSNVANLKKVWDFELNNSEVQECTPIVIDGMMYVTTGSGPAYTYGINAKTGEKVWTKAFQVPDDVARYACCGISNRGFAYQDGKLFVGRLDGKMTALNAQSGEELWTTEVVDYTQGSVITSPPLVVGNRVLSGFGGGEYGAVGYLSAYDINTGERVWQTMTTPESVAGTWKGDAWKTGGGVPWYIGSYDEANNTVIWGTSNPSPWDASLRGPDNSDYGDMTNLYTAATLGINPETGDIKWYYQTTPYDAWDYDGVNELVLADVDGQPAAMKADRNGFFYVLNRNTGKVISAEKFVDVNWAEKIDLETGRPVEDPKYRLTKTNTVNAVFPSFMGGKNWQPMAYNPQTGLMYIPANNIGMDFKATETEYKRGYFYLGTEWNMVYNDKSPGEYIAWDVAKQEKAWSKPLQFPIPGGAATTAGNLVFFGDLTGTFYALNATSGEELWTTKTTSGVGAAAMTYSVDGKQYVAVVEGRPTVIPGFVGGEMGENMVNATPAGGKVLVYAL